MPSIRRQLGLLLCLLLSCATPVAAQDALRGLPIKEIRFEGLRRLEEGGLINRINSRVGKPFDPRMLTEDLVRLHALGEFRSPDGRRPPVEARTESLAGGGVRITFVVHERRIITLLRVLGADALKQSEIDKALRSKAGKVHDPITVDGDAERLRQALIKRGYLYARVTTRAEEARGVKVYYEIRPGPKVTIDEIEFIGVRYVEDPEDIVELAGFESKPRLFWGLAEEGYFVRETMDEDLSKVERYYRSQGYLDARATLERLDFTRDREDVKVVIRVVEGERYTVRRIRIAGNRVISANELRDAMKLQPGRPFLGNDLLDDSQTIQKLYAEQAYIHARARFEVIYDRERKLLDIIYTVNEGPRVKVERILVEGNEKTNQKVIRRQLSLYPGDLFDGKLLEESLGRLGRLRYFDDVRLDFRPGSKPDSEDLVLQVKEARTGSFIIGGGVSTNAGFFANLSLNQRNFDIFSPPKSVEDIIEGRAFTGAGQNFSISAQPGRQRSQYRVSFTDPYLNDTDFILGTDGFIFQRVWPDYREQRLGGVFSLGYRLTEDLILRPSYRIEQVRIFDIDFDSIPEPIKVAGNNYVSGLELTLQLNKNLVDTFFVQYAGYGGSLSYEVVGGPFGGTVTLSRARVTANWQTTFWEFPKRYKWVFGLRGQAAWQEPYGRDKDTPIFERFFAGGVRSFRGFEFRSISPRDPIRRGEPVGGDFILLGTADISFPVFKRFLRGVIFMDMGTVEADIEDFHPHRIRYTAGFGFRINVAIFPAPVALDFAFPIRARRIDDEQVFSFSVGVGF